MRKISRSQLRLLTAGVSLVAAVGAANATMVCEVGQLFVNCFNVPDPNTWEQQHPGGSCANWGGSWSCFAYTNPQMLPPGVYPGTGSSSPGAADTTPSPNNPNCQNSHLALTAAAALIQPSERPPQGMTQEQGYVPVSNSTNPSGVTLAWGSDLSNWPLIWLEDWGITAAQATPFTPYLATTKPCCRGGYRIVAGPKGSTASAALAANGPLTASGTVADNLFAGVLSHQASVVANEYANDVSWTSYFTNLPDDVQAALTDIGFVNGSLPSSIQNSLVTGVWANTVEAINEFANSVADPGTAARLHNDAKIISNAIANHEMPPTDPVCP